MEFDWLALLIPFISAFIGWATNVLAVKMMFSPVDFVGVRPFLGWQGIVPANARKLAQRSTELIADRLIDLKAIFSSFDAEGFSENLDAAIDQLTEQIIEETAGKYGAETWDKMAESARAAVRQMVRAEVKRVIVEILGDMSENIEDILDLTDIVVSAVDRDKGLVGEMFQRVGDEEFRFIKASGAYFGFLFGVIQLGAWLLYPAWWVLPAFGFFVGYATNWLALKLIFEPAKPKKIGPWTIQGLFHKRQQQVAKQYAELVATDIINPDNMTERMVEGETGKALFAIIEKRLDQLVERYRENPMAAMLVPAGDWDEIRAELSQRVREELPKKDGFLYIFTARAIDVYGELLDRMTELDSESFEGVLRPPFQQDEWKLILAGAVLGLGAGILQVVYLFGDSIA